MTTSEIENGILRIKYSRYSTGVMHIAEPEWMSHLKWCIKVIEFLLEERKANTTHLETTTTRSSSELD